jgi:hypothetical protein
VTYSNAYGIFNTPNVPVGTEEHSYSSSVDCCTRRIDAVSLLQLSNCWTAVKSDVLLESMPYTRQVELGSSCLVSSKAEAAAEVAKPAASQNPIGCILSGRKYESDEKEMQVFTTLQITIPL